MSSPPYHPLPAAAAAHADLHATRLDLGQPDLYWIMGKAWAYILRLLPNCKRTRDECCMKGLEGKDDDDKGWAVH